VVGRGLPTFRTLWDDPGVCKKVLSADQGAHRSLVRAIAALDEELSTKRGMLPRRLARRLLVLSLLIAYLEDREVLEPELFARYQDGASRFFEVLGHGRALVRLLTELERRFNGDVFDLDEADRAKLLQTKQLSRFAALVEGKTTPGGQISFWSLYSFRDLPVELVSHIYEHFVQHDSSAVYTPPFLVRLMLDEALSWERLDRMAEANEVVLDPACGSGVFLVEAFKRMVLHWRLRHGWEQPDIETLKGLVSRVHGIDKNPDAIELAAFSLCLAMCEALDTRVLRASSRLFMKLRGSSLQVSCFFEAIDSGTLDGTIGAIVGNPPFESKWSTQSALETAERYASDGMPIPDKQVAYLFMLEAIRTLEPGGILCMLQPSGLLYNRGTAALRRDFIERWDLREVLDLVSIRGLFSRDTKVVSVIVEAQPPPAGRSILHATFRRTGRVLAQQGFDIDYYDLHRLPRELALDTEFAWRADLLGGGRVIDFVTRLSRLRTLREHADAKGWNHGEGFIPGAAGVSRPANHLYGRRLLPSQALTTDGVDDSAITTVERRPIERPRSKERFTAPMLLIREQQDLPSVLIERGYLTYMDQIVGLCAPRADLTELARIKNWLDAEIRPLQAYVAATSNKMLTQRATSPTAADILAIPLPEGSTMRLSRNERIIAEDILDHYRAFVRLGEGSDLFKKNADAGLSSFVRVYARQINTIYSKLRALPAHRWSGVVCQPFVFGAGRVDWSDTDDLHQKLSLLLSERQSDALNLRRIARIYDGPFIFLIKPDRLRYWLRSIALRDADDTLAELRAQGL